MPADKQVSARGIEVGHIFYFGTKYSAPMKAVVAGPDGAEKPVHMGSYGIGPSRLVAAIIEACHDEAGINWPEAVAPFKVDDPQPEAGRCRNRRGVRAALRGLSAKGVDVLYDDRDERPGAKFATADLIGVPWQILIGPKGLADGKVEVKNRADGSREMMSARRRSICCRADLAEYTCSRSLVRARGCRSRLARIRQNSREIVARWTESSMSEPTGTRPFSPFEWMLSLRYLRARRKEGFHLGHCRVFLPRHHARRRHTHHRHGGDERVPQRAARQDSRPQRPPADAAAGKAADRLGGGRRAHRQGAGGIRLAAPIVEGQALASSPFNAAGVLVRGIRPQDLEKLPSVANNIKQGTLKGFDESQGVAIGRRLADQLSLRSGDNITLVAPRGAVTPMGTTPRIKAYKIAAVFEIGMSEYDSAMVFMPLPKRRPISTAPATSPRSRSTPTIPIASSLPQGGAGRRAAPDLHDRLAPAQRDLLQRAAGRAQRDVPDPDADRAGGRAQHRLRPDV